MVLMCKRKGHYFQGAGEKVAIIFTAVRSKLIILVAQEHCPNVIFSTW